MTDSTHDKGDGGPPVSVQERRRLVEEHLAAVLEGSADDALLEFVASDDRSRDLVYDAERAIELALRAAADYDTSADAIEARLFKTLDLPPIGALASDVLPGTVRAEPLTGGAAPAEPEGSGLSRGVVSGGVAHEEGEGGGAPVGEETRATPSSRSPVAAGADATGQRERSEPSAPKEAASTQSGATGLGAAQAGALGGARALGGAGALGRLRTWLGTPSGMAGLVAAAAASLLIVQLRRGPAEHVGLGGATRGGAAGDGAAWEGTVESVASMLGDGRGLEVCGADGSECHAVSEGARVPPGARVRTDRGTQGVLSMAEGTRLVLGGDTDLLLDPDAARGAQLTRGRLLADVERIPGDGSGVVFGVPGGKAEVLGTKLCLEVDRGGETRLEVSRGAVRLSDDDARAVTVRSGQEARIEAGVVSTVAPAVELGRAMSWGERELPAQAADARAARELGALPAQGLGELRAQRPGTKTELVGAVTLTRHAVRVRVAGVMARTEVDEVFNNHTSQVLEGIYRFPLPPDAQIESLALEVDGKLVEGAFVDRERGAAIWRGAMLQAAPKAPRPREEIVWVPGPWKDPALLEWQRGGRFELHVYPIPKQGSRRVVLSYTQVVPTLAGKRRYTYPLPHDPGGSTKVAEFALDVEVRGHERQRGVAVEGYPLEVVPGDTEQTRLSLHAGNFTPSGDLSLEYALAGGEREVRLWGYRPEAASPLRAKAPGGSAAYVAFALRPELPRAAEARQRDYALVVDVSRSMLGESYRQATRLVERVVLEMEPLDRVTVLACDVTCQAMPGGPARPGRELARRSAEFLRGVVPEGGSDPAAAVAEALRVLGDAGERAQRVLYIGDGTPTVGAIEPGLIATEVSRAFSGGDRGVIAVAVGPEADLATLDVLADAGGGAVVRFAPGRSVADVAYSVLAASYGAGLSDVELELPAGMVSVAPARVRSLLAGHEVFVTARTERETIEGDVVIRGRLGGERWERRYPVSALVSSSAGNAFVPRLYAAARLADLERDGSAESRRQAIELSTAHAVASRYTSLIVLESPAMFRAFGLDDERKMALWTGEQEAEGEESGAQESAAETEDGLGLGDAPASGTLGSARGATAPSGMMGSAAPAAPRAAGATKRAAPRPASSMDYDDESADARVERVEKKKSRPLLADEMEPLGGPAPSRMNLVPMRRIWERVGSFTPERTVPAGASPDKLAELDAALGAEALSRGALVAAYRAHLLAGDFERAALLAERWAEKEPLDPEALTARADIAAERGERDLAIRILGSVVDVRPGDYKAQWRLARLHRWAGRPKLGCRHAMAVAQVRRTEAKLLVEAVRCLRDVGSADAARALLDATEPGVREAAERTLAVAAPDPGVLSGDLRLEARWGGGVDLDLVLLGPDGARVSWLGAPTSAIISARDVTSTSGEGLALRGAVPGHYVVEVVRDGRGGAGAVSGMLTVTVGKATRELAFVLDGERSRLGLAKLTMKPRLVPWTGPLPALRRGSLGIPDDEVPPRRLR